MDLDDFDGPKHVPSRSHKFAPRINKLQPQTRQPKTESKELIKAKSIQEEEENEVKPETSSVSKTQLSTSNYVVKLNTNVESMEVDAVGEFEGDAIVREIDVFFTQSLHPNTQLYVTQCPLRPYWRPYEFERCSEVRVKPASAEMEVDFKIDHSKNWDKDVTAKFKMTKQTVACLWKSPPVSSYAVGVLIGDKLHLNPIHAMVQLQPSTDKPGGSKVMANVSREMEVTVKLEESVEGKTTLPPNKKNKQMESTNEQKSNANECWTPLKYRSSDTDLASRYLNKVAAESNSPIPFPMNKRAYASFLCDLASNNKSDTDHDPSESVKFSDKTRKKSGRSTMIVQKTMSRETREFLLKNLPKIFQTHKVCSFPFICLSLQHLAIFLSTRPKFDSRVAQNAAIYANSRQEELCQVISEVATNIHGFYVLKSSPEHPEYDPLRKIVIDLLLAKGPNAMITKVEILEAAKIALERDVTNEYKKVVTDICEFKKGSWVLRSGDGEPS